MKKLELGKRIMLELIERKYAELKSNTIRIDENDFRQQDQNNMCYSTSEILDILLALEIPSRGKIKLQSATPENDRPKGYVEEPMVEALARSGGAKVKYPDRFLIVYDPFALEKKDNKKDIVTLSRKSGLCRVIDGKEVCYLPDRKSDRYKILFALEEDFIPTKTLVTRLSIELRPLMAQIGDMREQIENTIKRTGSEIIQNKKGYGYRLDPSIKIIS